MCDKREVERLYFEEKLSCADIAKAVGISHQAVSKILKKNPEYKNEKERRKKENKLKHNKQIADCVKRKRKRLREEEREKDIEILSWLEEQQEQNAREMSIGKKLSSTDFIAACMSQYKYDPGRERLVFMKGFAKKPFDLPRSVSVHKEVFSEFRKYAQDVESEKWTSTTEMEALGR